MRCCFFSLTGLALGRFREEKTMHWSTVPLLPLDRWLGGGVIFLSLLYGAEVARTALSDRIYEQALASEDIVPYRESIVKAEEALGYDSGNVQALEFLGNLHRDQASLKKTTEEQIGEGLKALDAYQKASKANSLDDSLQSRIGDGA